MVRPTFRPFARPRRGWAASMIPGPPPVHTTKRRSFWSSAFDHFVRREASSARGFVVDGHPERRFRPFLVLAAFALRTIFRGVLARLDARRAHENDGVVDLVAVEAALGLEILRTGCAAPGRPCC